MITIKTKKLPNGTWFCFSTIKGYDYYFEGKNMEIVQNCMRKVLSEKGIRFANWLPEIIYLDPNR